MFADIIRTMVYYHPIIEIQIVPSASSLHEWFTS